MFGSFFKVAFRKFFRYGANTLTNVFVLAIGISSSIIIFLHVNRETGYDRFHDKADNIYRVVVNGSVADNELNHAVTPAPLAKVLTDEIDEIGNAVRIARFGAWLVRYGEVHYNEDNLIFADPSFFEIFSFHLIRGDPEDALKAARSMVISKSTAEKYFGEEDPLGKGLQIENDTTFYRVTGIMEDVPSASHLHFDMVASLSSVSLQPYEHIWSANLLYTYFLARDRVSEDLLAQKVQQLAGQYALPAYAALMGFEEQAPDAESLFLEYRIQRLRDIHLRSSLEAEFEQNGNVINVYLFTILAVVILFISCLNFVNLATARTANRAREVGIRKIAGSERKVLIRQFLTETSLLVITAMVLALLITELILPPLNGYLGLDLDLSQLVNASGVLMLILLIPGIGILSGLYPAFYLSSFDPLRVLKSSNRSRPNHGFFRRAFVFFQFFVSIGLITMTLIIFRQYEYMIRKDLGFDRENLLVIRRPDGLGDQLKLFMDKAENHPGVATLTHSTAIPGSGGFSRLPFRLQDQPASQNVRMDVLFVTPTFTSTLGIPLIAGRFFSPDMPGDTAACVMNRTAADLLGLSDPAGQRLTSLGGGMGIRTLDIIGIVDDVHYESLENQVQPLVMVLMTGNMEGYLTVRLESADFPGTIDYLDGEWDKINSAYPFVSFFLDDSLLGMYRPVREAGRLFLVISFAAILLSCLGLYSLMAYTFCQRRFEHGVRKVLGASVSQIILMQFREVLLLILPASVVAWTGVYFLAMAWLGRMYFHIDLYPLNFIISPLILMVALGAASGYQAWVEAETGPVRVLKYE